MSKKAYENIRKIREMNNLTRDYVAGELQMSTSGYGKIERGEIDLTISKLYKIAFIFGVSVTDLLFFDVSKVFENDILETNSKKLSDKNQSSFKKENIFDLDRLKFLLKNG
jgi:transcriptional regulator with XRE-family HTH domain